MKRVGSVNRVFRILVVAAFLLHTVLWLGPFTEQPWLESVDVWLLDFDGYGAAMPYHPILYWCLFASWLLVLVGLFFYVSAARGGLILLILVSLALGIAWGVRVLAPHEVVLSELLSVIDGALIVMAYWSPVRAEFARAR